MMKNKWLVAALIAAVSLSLLGCPGTPNGAGDGTGGGGAIATPKPSTTISANVAGAKYIATTEYKKSNSSRFAGRAAGADVSELIVVKEDGSLNEDVLTFSDEIDDGSKWLHNVLEVYSCDKGEESNKGTYVVFEWVRDDIKFKDGTDAPGISQVIFINKEGKVFDVLKDSDGNVGRNLYAWIKDYNGEEYIRFDDKGNIFLLGQEWQDGKDSINTIYRWNSANGLQKYSLDEKINYICNFTISSDGSWVFVNADVKTDAVEDNNYNAVYAFEVNTNKAPIILYQSKKGKRWAVPTIAVDPQNRVYFYASAWDDPMGVDGGLFVLNKTSSGYSKANLKRYKILRWHEIDNFVRTAVKTEAAKRTVVRVSDMVGFDYEKLLADIKSYTNYDGEVEFSLAYFKDKVEEHYKWYNEDGSLGGEWDDDLSVLYKEDEDGNPLTDVAALKYLLETKSNHFDENNDYSNDLYAGESLFYNEFKTECHHSARNAEYKVCKNGTGGGSVPLDYCLVDKKTKKPVFKAWELAFLKSEYADLQSGLFLSNDSGVWVYNDVWVATIDPATGKPHVNARGEQDQWERSHGTLLNIVDTDGQFTEDPYVGSLKTTKLYCADDGEQYGGENPSKRLPFAANTNGVAAIDVTKTTIYYQEGKKDTVNLLEKYDSSIGNSITEILSFNLDDEVALVNTYVRGGAYITMSIDLSTREITKLGINKRLDSMVRR